MAAPRLTVALVVVAAATLLGAPALATHLFSDVPDDHTHAEGIEWSSLAGLVEGFPDGTFRPAGSLSRGQLATILQRQNAWRGPVYSLTPECGSLAMRVIDHNHRGSGAATVEYSVNGGDRVVLDQSVPPEGFMTFDAHAPGIVSFFVDDIAWAHAPTAQDCTPPAP